MSRNTYTDEQRTEALSLYQDIGTTATSKRLSIPRRTILEWAKAAGLIARADAGKTAAATAANVERVQAAWGDYREREALGAGAAAVKLREGVLTASEAENERLLRARAIAYGIMIDKAELLSGRATQRIETWAESELDASIRHLIREMEDRIVEDAGAPAD